MEGDIAEVSPKVMAVVQGSASMLPTLPSAGETVPVEAPWQEGPVVSMSEEESSRDLTRASGGPEAWGRARIEWADPQNPGAMVFTLDDVTEGSEWRGLHASMGGVA
jgi:hypothetical protein